MTLYEDTLSAKELRAEVRRAWDEHAAFESDLRDLPEAPSTETLRHLAQAAMNIRSPDLWAIGKEMQRRRLPIPYKTEYECAAGLWQCIRAGILGARGQVAETAHDAEGSSDAKTPQPAASVGRSAERQDRADGLGAEHEHAVPEGQTPNPHLRSPKDS